MFRDLQKAQQLRCVERAVGLPTPRKVFGRPFAPRRRLAGDVDQVVAMRQNRNPSSSSRRWPAELLALRRPASRKQCSEQKNGRPVHRSWYRPSTGFARRWSNARRRLSAGDRLSSRRTGRQAGHACHFFQKQDRVNGLLRAGQRVRILGHVRNENTRPRRTSRSTSRRCRSIRGHSSTDPLPWRDASPTVMPYRS